MIDVNWDDNAKASVREFANYIGQSDKCERYLASVETKKTVADAVEAFPDGFPETLDLPKVDDWWFNSNGGLVWVYELDGLIKHDLVCTREQFEAYVKEQEGEKWTHTYTHFQPCRIEIEKPDEHGCIVVYVQGDGYITCGPDDIKPIKPTLTKSEAWDLLMKNKMNSAEVNTIKQQYDII